MSQRDWIRLAERKEKEARRLLQEAQAFRNMAAARQPTPSREQIVQTITEYTCAGYADDKVLGVERAADEVLRLIGLGLVGPVDQ